MATRIKIDDPAFTEHMALVRANLLETLDANTEQILNRMNESPVTKGKTVITISHEGSKKAMSANLTFDTISINPKKRDTRKIQGEDPDQQPLPLGQAQDLLEHNERGSVIPPEEPPVTSKRGRKKA